MANPKIQVDIAGDASKLKKAAKEADDALEKVDKSVDKVGKKSGGFDLIGDKAGDLARDKLGPLGEAIDNLGFDMDDMSPKALAAGAAIGGIGAIAFQGVQKLSEMTDEVRAFRDAAGIGWEDSSRLVSVLDDLGISAETGATSMGRLAKNIDTGALEEFGIEAVKAKDGTIDMAATLGNVADRMMQVKDPTERAAMGTKLFGRSWADLMPLLEQGGANIREAMAGVKDYQIVTADSAQEQREMAMAIDDMQDAFSGLQMELAAGMVPTITKVATGFAELINGINKLNDLGKPEGGGKGFFEEFFGPHVYAEEDIEALQEAEKWAGALNDATSQMIPTALQAAGAAGKLAEKEDEQADAAEKAAETTRIYKERQEEAAEASRKAAEAVARQRAEVDKLNGSVMTIVGTQLAYDSALAATIEATDSLTQRQLELDDANATYGEGSAEAWEATKNYENGIRNALSAVDAQAQATVNLAEQTALAGGAALTAEQQNLIYRDALVKVRDATNDPNLRAGLDGLIGQVDGTAAAAGRAQQNLDAAEAAARRLAAAAANAISISSSGEITTSADSAERALQRRASGGPVNAGTPYLVGERGPEVVVPGASGAVIDNQRMNGGMSGRPMVIQLLMDGRQTAEVIVPHQVNNERSRR